MSENPLTFLKQKLDAANFAKLSAIQNSKVHQFIANIVELCEPADVFVCSDAQEDIQYVREQAPALREEIPLQTPGHTYHFDGMQDQGRDREVTKYLVPKGDHLSQALNQIEREEGLAEVLGLLKGAMRGRTLIVRFLALSPLQSPFTILCLQCTDSFYVAHSEELLYRRAYNQFVQEGEQADFFQFIHSAGKLTESMVSAEPEKKRIYIDYATNTVYSVNTQYAGNSVGLKKLALRLAIRKADREGWLAEHMFLMGVHGPNGRKTYLAGAFPSACGKTSTAMLPGETILGDDLAYFRNINGVARAVNIEAGIFGIIQDVSPTSDPVIYETLTQPNEVIFSNVLIKDRKPYWLGMGCELPTEGINYSGQWYKGKKDENGREILPAHKNARYTVALSALANCDPALHDPDGVEVKGIMYGGRDYKGYVPVQQSFNWAHGIIAYGAALETETTFATVGAEGVPEINLMSIQDFLSIPFGKYLKNNLDFGASLSKPPLIFGVNYFLRDLETGQFLNAIPDKAVWVKWMDLRIHGEVDAIMTPTGWIPTYEVLADLFRKVLKKEYSESDYIKQFTIRIPQNLAKMERVEQFHRRETPDAPPILWEIFAAQKQRLLDAQARFGDYVPPARFREQQLWTV